MTIDSYLPAPGGSPRRTREPTSRVVKENQAPASPAVGVGGWGEGELVSASYRKIREHEGCRGLGAGTPGKRASEVVERSQRVHRHDGASPSTDAAGRRNLFPRCGRGYYATRVLRSVAAGNRATRSKVEDPLMLRESKRAIHFGLNFVLAPAVVADRKRTIAFQSELVDAGFAFDQVQLDPAGRGVTLSASQDQPLSVQLANPAPHVTQFLMVASPPRCGSEEFAEQAEGICKAFRSVWPEQHQIVSRDACVRHLYQAKTAHSFEYLWGQRLKQNLDDFQVFGRTVLGGGLRLVLPPTGEKKTQIDVKVETFLQDPRSIFIETQYAWPFPCTADEAFQPKALLREVDQFASGVLIDFLMKEDLA